MSVTNLFAFSLLCNIVAASLPPRYLLNDGHYIPSIGLGTWSGIVNSTQFIAVNEDALEQAISWAIDMGYRLFDTAFIYNSEKPLGRAVQRKIDEGTVKREDLFIISKVWYDMHAREAVISALQKSLETLSMDYVDLYLIQTPIAQYPNLTCAPIDYVETWQGMIDAKDEGLTRSIGLSNFNEHMIDRVIENTCVKPAVVEIEVNLHIQQPSILEYCCRNNIAVLGYTPFGSIFPDKALPGAPGPRIDDRVLQQIANNHNKTVPQIILRYLLDLGVIPIPKSTNKSRIKENIDVFDFRLSRDELVLLGGYDVNYRSGLSWSDSPYCATRITSF